jgi:ABC-2 type transport system permease protein
MEAAMNLRRILILFRKEVFLGMKNYLFIFALVMPVLFTLVVTVVFGTFLSGKARMGVVDLGQSALPALAGENQALLVQTYHSELALRDAVERGAVDVGLVLPSRFDQQVRASEVARIVVYVWGESQMQHRIILSTAAVRIIREIAGQELPIEIAQTVLGDGANIPWAQRLFPLMVMMTMLLAGTMVPSTLLVGEKVNRTLSALAVSPATLGEIFAAKGLLGVLLGMFTGVMILLLNRAFGGQPALLLAVMLLSTIFTSMVGLLLGALVKDINTLFATLKGLGIVLYAPGFIQLFPDFPQWVARLFPTYYAIQPVIDISQRNAGLAQVLPDLAVLAALSVVMFVILALMTRRTREAVAAV